jgi:hypothetical protein
MAGKYWWIKERHNPQFKDPYYVACGQITAKEAKAHENLFLYGTNYMHKFSTKEEYEARIKELGLNVVR